MCIYIYLLVIFNISWLDCKVNIIYDWLWRDIDFEIFYIFFVVYIFLGLVMIFKYFILMCK